MIATLFPGLAALPNSHPLFVHFPIALTFSAMAMEALAFIYDEKYHRVATWMLYLAAIAAVVTTLTGVRAMNLIVQEASAEPSGFVHDHIHVHLRWMVVATAAITVLAAYVWWVNRASRWKAHRVVIFLGLVLVSTVIALGADRGARLVFEFGVGVKPMAARHAIPEPNRH